MPSIASLRSLFPNLADADDKTVIELYAQDYGLDPKAAAEELGYRAPTFGSELKTALPRALGQSVQGIGQVAEDLGWDENPIKAYGQRVIERNPTQINSLGDIADYPMAALGSGTGNAAAFLGTGGALGLVGKGAKLYGAARAGQLIGGGVGQTVNAALPSYGGIREAQLAEGNDAPTDMLAAAAGAGAVGWIEQRFGLNKMLGLSSAPKQALRAEVAGMAKTPIRTAAKEWLGMGLAEGAEELIQNPIEQLAAYQDPTTAKNVQETLFGGAMGALGGLGLGGYGGARAGLQHQRIRGDLRQDMFIAPDASSPTDLLQGLDRVEQYNQVEADRAAQKEFDWVPEHVYRGQEQDISQVDPEAFAFQQEQAREEQKQALRDTLTAKGVRADKIEGVVSLAFPEKKPPKAYTKEQQDAYDVLPDSLSEKQKRRAVKRLFPTETSTAAPATPYLGKVATRNLAQVDLEEAAGTLTANEAATIRSMWENSSKTQAAAHAIRRNVADVIKAKQGAPSVPPPAQTVQGQPPQAQPAAAPAPASLAPTAPPPPPKPASKEELPAYKAAMVPWLTSTLTPEEFKALEVVSGVSREAAGDEEAVTSSLRVAAKTLGVSHETVRQRAAAAETKIEAQAQVAGFDLDTAHQLLGMQSSADVMDQAPVSLAQAAQSGLSVQRPERGEVAVADAASDQGGEAALVGQFGDAAEFDEGFRPEGQTAAMPEATVEADDAGFALTARDHQGHPIRPVDFEDAALEWKENVDGQDIPKQLLTQFTKLWIANEDGVLNDRTFHEQIRALRQQAGELRRVPEVAAGVEDEESAEVVGPAGTPGQPAQVATRKAPATGIPEKVAKPKKPPKAKPAAQAPLLPEIDLWEQAWDEVAAAADVSTWKALTESQRAHLMSAGSDEDLQARAVNAIVAELKKGSDVEPYENPVASTKPVEVKKKGRKVVKPSQAAPVSFDTKFEKDGKPVVVDGIKTDALGREQIKVDGEWKPASEFARVAPKGMKSSEGEEGQGTTAKEIEGQLKGFFFSGERFRRKVTVVQSRADLPASVRDAEGVKANTQAFVIDGHAYMIANNIPVDRTLSVLLHEVGVHLGMRGLVGEANYKALVAQVKKWEKQTGTKESGLAKRARKRVEAAETEEADQDEELLAYFIEEAVNAGVNPAALHKTTGPLQAWFRTMWAAVKSALRKFGFDRVEKLTAADLVNLAYGAARLEIEGTWHGTASEHRVFSHEFMGKGEGAQVYGWGTYIAERPGIAKGYWEADIGRKSRGSSIHISNFPGFRDLKDAARADDYLGYENAADVAGAALQDGMKAMESNYDMSPELTKVLGDYVAWAKARGGIREGSLMRIDTSVHEDEFLDWDKPLSEQSEKVKEALRKIGMDSPEAPAAVAWRHPSADKWEATIIGSPVAIEASKGKFRVYDALDLNWELEADTLEEAKQVAVDGVRKFGGADDTGQKIYHRLSVIMNKRMAKNGITRARGDKVTSQYLDSLGIKGIKFADSQSRQTNPATAADIPVLENNLVGKSFRYEDKEALFTVAPMSFAKVKPSGLYVNIIPMEEGSLATGGSVHIDELTTLDGKPALTEEQILEAIFAVKQFKGPNQTRNRVIFNDKNIHRVFSEVGADRGRLRFSQAAAVDLDPVAFTNDTVSNMIQRIKDTAADLSQKALNAVLFLHDLIDVGVKQGLTTAKGFGDLMGEKDQIRNIHEQKIDRIMERASKLNDQPLVEKFIRDSTLEQKWGYGDKADSAFVSRFKALSSEGQQVVKDVFAVGESDYAEMQRLTNLEINEEYDALIRRFPQNTARYNKERARDIARMGRAMPKREGPYAPLKRFGDHVVVAKSQAYMDAEAAGDDKLMQKLIEDKTKPHYLVQFFETAGAAAAYAKQIQPGFTSVVAANRQQNFHKVDELPWSGIAKIKAKIEDSPDRKYKESMERLVTNLYLQMLADSSARKSEIRRKGVLGSGDMFRAFAAHGRSNAHYLAAMTKNKEIARQITAMRNEAHAAHGDVRDGATRVYNEIMARYDKSLDYKETPWVDKALRASSIWLLLSSPAYYMTNATQTYMVAMPVLGGRYGGRAFTEISKAYGDVSKFVGKMGTELDLNTLPVSAAEKTMLRDLQTKGKLDINMTSDLGRWASGAADQGIVGRTMQKLYGASAKVEALNRITTALAAYRLSGDVGYAGDMVDQTQGNYAGSNAPRFFTANGGAKLITQFRKYQLIQISLMGRLIHDGFAGASKEEKAVARRALAWLFAQQAIMTGVKGLPIPAVLYMLAAALGGDDDKDWERNLRKWIGDEDMATLLIQGVPAWMGLDVSGRIGMGNAFSVLPFSDIEFSKKGYKEAVFGASGAFVGGMGGQLADGIDKMAKGKYYKGVESLMPRGLRDAMAGYRIATEGVTTGRGDVVLSPEEISTLDGAMKAVGLPTTKYTEFQTSRGDLYELGKHFNERDTEVKDEYARAAKERDAESMTAARVAWKELQEAKARWRAEMTRRGFGDKKLLEDIKPQPLSTLLKAPATLRKREQPWERRAQVQA